MGRIIAIDYGTKRTGLAVTDPLKIIANGLITLPEHEVIEFLENYIRQEDVELILLGEPRQMNYQPSESMGKINIFRKKIKKSFPDVELKMVDERFTSVLAHKTMLEAGLSKKKRRNKELVDEISATIMLQTYLESEKK